MTLRQLAPALLIASLAPASPASMEEIYLARSVGESKTAPTAFCAASRTGFEASSESVSSLRTLATDPATGRVVNANAGKSGELRICMGPASKPSEQHFYGEGQIAGVPFTGKGLCNLHVDTPVAGLISLRCYLDLSGLPEPYSGGLFTTNSIASRNGIGMISDPPGYTQTSMVTARLWRKSP